MCLRKLLPLLGCLLMVSCTVTNPVPPPAVVVPPSLSDIPARPSLVPYPQPPVLAQLEENYLVRKELITNITLLTDYYNRIEVWKKVKNFQ